jgi:hypothetical protein
MAEDGKNKMELELLKWIALGLLSIVTYFLQRTVNSMEERFRETKLSHTALQVEVQGIKNEYLHKNDFRDFKVELRAMFDELKSDIKGLRHS